jgi:hypothetical protein
MSNLNGSRGNPTNTKGCPDAEAAGTALDWRYLRERRGRPIYLLRDRNFGAELHWLVLDFLAACAEGNSCNNGGKNNCAFHHVSPSVSIGPELTLDLLISRYAGAKLHRLEPDLFTSAPRADAAKLPLGSFTYFHALPRLTSAIALHGYLDESVRSRMQGPGTEVFRQLRCQNATNWFALPFA